MAVSCVKCIVITIGVAVVGGIGFLYSGFYQVGADNQHNGFTYWALETLRERSISRASSNIKVPPDLDNPNRLLVGGADYNDMCSGCHLKPGKVESDLALGLYPAPPNLTDTVQQIVASDEQARRRFWIIKHGIKASGMPAWGVGHDDERIWNMVAFLQRLPDLSPEQYQILTARGTASQDVH
ncbi:MULTISPECIES: c-type cytochrome [Kangiella]|uniref:Cytochrome c family protein n=1 Tax=Kangiella koreensis (strain DSM 16069 / JCM 12317 / KCTC 12182 / SW-125) TaxID=523791 RepID=C7RBR8_KANKD|nr:cytochrome c [Kangiella koreensis]ACV26710.1 cytochrome c family protein [Kangiella koreensis DSM 16069]